MGDETPEERLVALETNFSWIKKSLDSGEIKMKDMDDKLDKLLSRSPWRVFAAVLGVTVPTCALVWGIATHTPIVG